jgi:hypothetical protein
MSEGYEFYLSRLSDETEEPSVTRGASGYFSAPSTRLDPHLFHGDSLRGDVKDWILETLYDFWQKYYKNPQRWSTAWLAGSGISYQWEASRGNGDLDVLIGVDFPEFYRLNPAWQGTPEDDMADIFNKTFKDLLWTRTAETNLNGQVYEVTFYVNPNSTDIRDINPYAAYDLNHNSWTVRPPVLPENPRSQYPKEYWAAVARERAVARRLVERYMTAKNDRDAAADGSPGHVNALARMRTVVDQASSLFNDIHLGRRNAFKPGGSGYGDFYNFRWQAHKESGAVQALHTLTSLNVEARQAEEIARHGAPIDDAHTALSKAAQWSKGLV